MKKLYIGTNTKMYKLRAETAEYVHSLALGVKECSEKFLQLFVIPSFTALDVAVQSASGSNNILIGAQNVCWAERGQFTGEISPLMLQELSIEIVEIGHSERRHIMHETNREIHLKVAASLNYNFTTLLCIGELQEEKDADIGDDVLRLQIKSALHGIPKEKLEKLWIAYEPVWAIGNAGYPADAKYVTEKHLVIRQTLIELYGSQTGDSIPILYGGSVNKGNCCDLICCKNVDGLFIGRSAWNVGEFLEIINKTIDAWKEKQ